MESYMISTDVGAAPDSIPLLVTAQQGGLTQGLVVVVILIVIALALILICGLLGRRDEARPVAVVGDDAEEPAGARIGSPVESRAELAGSGLAEGDEVAQKDAKVVTEAVSERAEPAVERASLIEETTSEQAVPPRQPDDLKRIEGIGPKVSGLLNESGVFTFAQLAGTDVDRLRVIVDEAGLTMMNPASWPEQARLAASGDWDALARLQDDLKGGRHV
jgi:predicted flap endonuclease-1-like 5' DNA nuclease